VSWRKIRLPYPDEEERPWLNHRPLVKRQSCGKPYGSDGLIPPDGWFFKCRPGAHSYWARQIGVNEVYLEKLGWVFVWSYESMFYKPGQTPTPYFRWSSDKGLTVAQKATMIDWCSSRKVSLERACGKYRVEEFKDDRHD